MRISDWSSDVCSSDLYRLQGQKTAAFEIVEALGRAPDVHCLPVGNAGNISAYWLGYSEMAGIAASYSPYHAEGRFLDAPLTNKRPRMAGYQADRKSTRLNSSH